MEREGAAEAVYVCPTHSAVRAGHPEKCPACGTDLVREGGSLAFLRHAVGDPLHFTLMVIGLVIVMAGAMMLLR